MAIGERKDRALVIERMAPPRAVGSLLVPVARRHRAGGHVSRDAIASALDMTSDAVFFTTPDLQIVQVNAAAIDGTGFSSGQLKQMNLRELLPDECEGQLRANVARLMRREVAETAYMARPLCNDRAAFLARVCLRLFEQSDSALIVAVVQRTCESDEWIVGEAGRDYLTGLPSREALEARLRRTERQARSERDRFAVLFVDLDEFKSINDCHGHRIGDLVLRKIANRLLGCMRPGDFVGRYGGDEFVAVVDEVCRDSEIDDIAERIRRQLALPVEVAGHTLHVSASVGVALGHASSSVEQVLDEADRDMYRIKRSYREPCKPDPAAKSCAGTPLS